MMDAVDRSAWTDSAAIQGLAVSLLRIGVTAAHLRQLADAAAQVSGQEYTTVEALGMLERIHNLTHEDPTRTTLATYGRALTEAINQANYERIQRGVDLVRPILEAHEQLDLTNA